MKTNTPIRLALRVEGEWWVAYVATTGTMDGAFEIARVRIAAAKQDATVAEAFKAMTRKVLENGLADIGAVPLDWSEQAAPQSERAGRA